MIFNKDTAIDMDEEYVRRLLDEKEAKIINNIVQMNNNVIIPPKGKRTIRIEGESLSNNKHVIKNLNLHRGITTKLKKGDEYELEINLSLIHISEPTRPY